MKKTSSATPRTGKNFLVPRANKDRKVSTLLNGLGKSTPSIRPDQTMNLPAPRGGPTLGAGPSVSPGAPDLFSQPGNNGAPKF